MNYCIRDKVVCVVTSVIRVILPVAEQIMDQRQEKEDALLPEGKLLHTKTLQEKVVAEERISIDTAGGENSTYVREGITE